MIQRLYTLLLATLLVTQISAQANSLIDQDCDLPCVQKTFMVHVHLVQDSMGTVMDIAEIQSQLDYTSVYFEPICIDFEVCAVDTLFDYSFDSIPDLVENSELTVRLIREQRINIYAFSNFDNDNNVDNGGIAGLGGGGVVWVTRGAGAETMAHEMGHVFGLLHTFETGDELVNGSNCETAGDMICDTPADPYVEGADTMWVNGCEFIFLGVDANGQLYQPQTGNTMSYYCGGCGFTKEQLLKMAETATAGYLKDW